MATMRGSLGKVMIGGATTLEVKSWTLTIATDKEDTTALGATAKTQAAGLAAVSGSITCSRDPGDTSGQVVLAAAALSGANVTLLLYESATKYWSVVSLIDMEESVEAAGIVGATYSFTSSGAVSYN